MLECMKKRIKAVIANYATITLKHQYVKEDELFKDKVVVITGGTGDIGQAAAGQFLRQGADVVLVGRNVDRVKMMEETGCHIVKWDITDGHEREEKFNECLSVFGKIDIWVNCAGYISHNDLKGDFFHSTEEDWNRQMDINCKALYFLTQLAGKYFYENCISGHIVQVLSIGGVLDTWQPYGISKRVAIEFTRGIAKTLAPYHIVVNGVVPGQVQTKMLEGQLDGNLRLASAPDKRGATKEEIANIICFLASDMADHMIGSMVVCDGGATLLN